MNRPEHDPGRPAVQEYITIEGARQNNLKGFSLRIPLGQLIVVTGVSGSGKSSLAFDTIYAEGQRRYVETFSPYTRQFLGRMDKPQADRIEGIPPAIAIDQTNPVRTSRSTVGTMTELNDHLKLLFARAAQLHCRGCGKPVRRDSPDSIMEELELRFGEKGPEGAATAADAGAADAGAADAGAAEEPGRRLLIAFPVPLPRNLPEEEVLDLLAKQGYHRILGREGDVLRVIQDRIRLRPENRGRILEDLEAALRHGGGTVEIHPAGEDGVLEAPIRFSDDLHCPDCDIRYRDPVPNLFSFNSPIGACDSCRGFGRIIGIDYGLVTPDPTRTIRQGAIRPFQGESYRECQEDLEKYARERGVPLDVPWQDLDEDTRRWVLAGEGPWEQGVWYGVDRFFAWLESKSYRMHIRVLLSRYRSYGLCPACEGARLKPEALLYRIEGLSLRDVMLLPIDRCLAFFSELRLPAPADEATGMLLGEIRQRLRYLTAVGLGYLTLDRQSRTLSGGEVQRINLTTALGTSLVNTLFILDEPSIGLHPRDIDRLIGILTRLRDAGNTIIVVEHDPDVIRAADLVIDMGPAAGEHGGEIVYTGTFSGLVDDPHSLTGRYLSGEKRVRDAAEGTPAGASGSRSGDGSAADDGTGTRRKRPERKRASGEIRILGAEEHNLKGIDVSIPLGTLACITGVSGSGKSTLVEDILYRGLLKLKRKPVEQPGAHREILGHELVDEVVMVDQSPIGRTARSNPASYVGAFDAVRKLFAAEPLARERDYTAGTFSFNAGTGRCPTCKGTGYEHIEMQFLSDVYLRCPECDGRRYRKEILEVALRGESIADVLEMTVQSACEFFAAEPDVLRGLAPLRAVGLDYLRLGQPVPTLSGGEAQRLKLAGYLAESRGRKRGGRSLFLFDEPTTGLHFDDIAVLLRALRELIAAGHSVVLIEHNLDVIAASDRIVDLGPEGGEAGGLVVCEGTPQEIARCPGSRTGNSLREYFARETALAERASGPAREEVTAGGEETESRRGKEPEYRRGKEPEYRQGKEPEYRRETGGKS